MGALIGRFVANTGVDRSAAATAGGTIQQSMMKNASAEVRAATRATMVDACEKAGGNAVVEIVGAVSGLRQFV